MPKEKELWTDIKGYKGRYQISSFGRVRSLDRIVKRNSTVSGRGCAKWTTVKGKILTPCNSSAKYPMVILSKNNTFKTVKVHLLVGKYFVQHPPHYNVLNHLDKNKWNCRHSNLEWSNQRENSSHSSLHDGKKTSKYIGVHKSLRSNKWISSIKINRKTIILGRFDRELDAAKAYRVALKQNNLINKYATV